MSPKPRLPHNVALPTRWQITHGAVYYRVPPGQEHRWDGKTRFRLGGTLAEAHRTWAERMDLDSRADIRTVGQLLDRYLLEVIPAKAPKTQREQRPAVGRLREVFGPLPLADHRPQHVYRYYDQRSAKTAASRELEILSHAYTKAVEWGLIARHPTLGQVRLPGEQARDRYVEDWEVIEALSLPARRRRGSVLMVQAYIRLKLLTGMARGDLLRLTVSDLREDGIHIQRHKTRRSSGKRTIYAWDTAPDEHGIQRRELGRLWQAVEAAKAVRPVDISPFIFCTRMGQSYVDEAQGTANGWDSLWGRFMTRVLAETAVTERFHEHDLRAKAGSDADSREHARALLSHVDARLTDRVYRRRPEVVKPGKGV